MPERSWALAVTVAAVLGFAGGIGLLLVVLGTTGEVASVYVLVGGAVVVLAAVRCAPAGRGAGHWVRVAAVTCLGLGVACGIAFVLFIAMLSEL